ncbi:hypothetical protein PC128_g24679 [Phytophthora cactorum]|nr:hypothetical protein PC128_g24679 [Phytophthora cactorum]
MDTAFAKQWVQFSPEAKRPYRSRATISGHKKVSLNAGNLALDQTSFKPSDMLKPSSEQHICPKLCQGTSAQPGLFTAKYARFACMAPRGIQEVTCPG